MPGYMGNQNKKNDSWMSTTEITNDAIAQLGLGNTQISRRLPSHTAVAFRRQLLRFSKAYFGSGFAGCGDLSNGNKSHLRINTSAISV